ncbi:10329_t:CDS:2 [Funneliformis caledonium]|uniref:10329_t:CDS:1 n=1 Tax=Funneliformis caledonium TaxID=1117310 RepID=A0A9N9DHL7_9GLOM|nr:10329_t:CDS:2 [Funneliformis caledonium]
MACIYRGNLLYFEKTSWSINNASIDYLHNETYVTSHNLSSRMLIESLDENCHINCRKPPTRRSLTQTLHGLTGIMGYSRNIRAHALSSETFGASKRVAAWLTCYCTMNDINNITDTFPSRVCEHSRIDNSEH